MANRRRKQSGIYLNECGSRNLHECWGISTDGKIIQNKYIKKNIKEKLIELSGCIHEGHFCEDCINEVKRRHPNLDVVNIQKVEPMSDHAYSSSKKRKLEGNGLLENALNIIGKMVNGQTKLTAK